MPAAPSFGQWLKQRRAALGLTQNDLALAAACSLSVIRKYESGARRPSRATVELLADLLEIAPEQRAAFVTLALFDGAAADDGASVSVGFLPAPPTPLIGREGEVASVARRLLESTGRMVTLLGPPGVGKTRLAIAAAAALQRQFPDGAWFVALAPVSDAAQVGAAIARALGLKEPADGDYTAALRGFLRARRALLVLDNCEHVLDAAPLVADLLAACEALAVLATSRAPLNVRAERRLPVRPLALPAQPTCAAVADAPASALFIERAEAVAPGFALDEANAASVAAICARLDGLPLAIELAAARADTHAPAALLAQLEQRLAVLTDGPRDLHPHQQTLRATIGWSYDLLTDEQQASFARLGMFAGGCTTEAAAAAGARHLPQLRAKSLIQEQYAPDRTRRYVLLETLREFALAQLARRGELGAVQQRHAVHFAERAAQAEEQLRGGETARWLGHLDADSANLRAAMQWSLDHDGGARTAQIAAALFSYWRARGLFGEGGAWIEAALDCDGGAAIAPHTRARALFVAGFLRSQQGHPRTTPLLEGSLALYRELGDIEGSTRTLNALGMIARYPGNYERTLALLHESLALQRAHGVESARSNTLNQIGMALLERGDYPEAAQYFREEIALKRAKGSGRDMWMAQVYLAETHWRQNEWPQARALYQELLDHARAANDREIVAHVLRGLGIVATHAGDLAQAQAYGDESLRLYREMGIAYGPATVLPHLAQLALLRDEREAAARHATEGLHLACAIFGLLHIPACLTVQAVLALPAQPEHTARTLGVAAALEERFAIPTSTLTNAFVVQATAAARRRLGADVFTGWYDQAATIIQTRIPTVRFANVYAAMAAIDMTAIVAAAVAA